MKRKILTLITAFSMYCLVACGGEKTSDTGANDSNDVPVVTEAPEPTKEPSSEVEPTAEPVQEATPEPTEEPSAGYEGIDMESDLPGEEWVETFIGVIEEPKIVVFSDETGRKEIFENDSVIKFNPDTDMIGVYLPEGYTRSNMIKGIKVEYAYDCDYFYYCKLKPEETREKGKVTAAFYVEYNGEEIKVPFTFKPE